MTTGEYDLMEDLSTGNVLSDLERRVLDALPWQVTDSERPNYGGLVNAAWGLDDPSSWGTVSLIAGCVYSYLADKSPCISWASHQDTDELLERAILGAEYMLRAQRPSGLIDLRSANYDSSPDAAFAVQQLCALLDLGKRFVAPDDKAWRRLATPLETFIRRATDGILSGGFHTPNHRWVIASALAQATALFPDLQVRTVVESYLAEGIDIDDEGAFIERSTGVYDAICDRSLLLLSENWECPSAADAARTNLVRNLYLLHSDASIETGLSRRQDRGMRSVPLDLASCYLHSAALEASPEFVLAARKLWEHRQSAGPTDLTWLCAVLMRFGDPPAVAATLPEDFSRFFPGNGLLRVRRGLLSASFYRDSYSLVAIRYGRAELSSMSVSQSYFGVGRFYTDALEVVDGVATLQSEERSHPRRPGYDLPLGREVPPDRWREVGSERRQRPLPPCTSTVTVQEAIGRFELRYRTIDGLSGVTAQVAFDFPPGGVWETEDCCLSTRAGQVIFLKSGSGRMRYGYDSIEIGPGACAHTTWNMRDTPSAEDSVRVLMTFLTPADHTFYVRGDRGAGISG